MFAGKGLQVRCEASWSSALSGLLQKIESEQNYTAMVQSVAAPRSSALPRLLSQPSPDSVTASSLESTVAGPSPWLASPPPPAEFWQDDRNCVRFVVWFEKTLRLHSIDNWYTVERKAIELHGGQGLSARFGESVATLVAHCYPNHEWLPWKFRQLDRTFWSSISMRGAFFGWGALELGLYNPDSNDWERHLWRWLLVPHAKLSSLSPGRYGYAALVGQYGGSLLRTLKCTFPRVLWSPWFSEPKSDWVEISGAKLAWLEWYLAEVVPEQPLPLGTRPDYDLFYSTSREQLSRTPGGDVMLSKYGSTLAIASASAPFHNWLPWRFPRVPNGFWASMSNQAQYFQWVYKEHLKLQNLSDFYEVNLEQVVRDTGAATILAHCNPWPISGLKLAFPKHDWHAWKFKKLPKGFWSDDDHVRDFVKAVGAELGLPGIGANAGGSPPAAWYDITCQELEKAGGGSLVVLHNYKLLAILLRAFPEVKWEGWRFEKQSKGSFFQELTS